jgi:hypothetical protein
MPLTRRQAIGSIVYPVAFAAMGGARAVAGPTRRAMMAAVDAAMGLAPPVGRSAEAL